MEFLSISKSTNLSVEQMNDIYNNFQYLKQRLEDEGFTVGELVDSSVTYSISPANILNKFNNVEQNIRTINSTLINIYGELGDTFYQKFYKEFTWQPTTQDRKTEVWRWVDWLNEAKILANKYELLRDINNEQIFDVNNERILILQEVNNG